MNDDQILNILLKVVNELDELNGDLHGLIAIDCENEAIMTYNDSDNSGED